MAKLGASAALAGLLFATQAGAQSDPFHLEGSDWREILAAHGQIRFEGSTADQSSIILNYSFGEGENLFRQRFRLEPSVRLDGHKIDGRFETMPSPYMIENNGCAAEWYPIGNFQGCFSRNGKTIGGLLTTTHSVQADGGACRAVPLQTADPGRTIQIARRSPLPLGWQERMRSDRIYDLHYAILLPDIGNFPMFSDVFIWRENDGELGPISLEDAEILNQTMGRMSDEQLQEYRQKVANARAHHAAQKTWVAVLPAEKRANELNRFRHWTNALRHLSTVLSREAARRGLPAEPPAAQAAYGALDCDYPYQSKPCPSERDGYLLEAGSNLREVIFRARKEVKGLPGRLMFDAHQPLPEEADRRNLALELAQSGGVERELVAIANELQRWHSQMARFYQHDQNFCDNDAFLRLEADFNDIRERLAKTAKERLDLWQKDRDQAITTLAEFRVETWTWTEYKILGAVSFPTSFSDFLVMVANVGYDLPPEAQLYANTLDHAVNEITSQSKALPNWARAAYGHGASDRVKGWGKFLSVVSVLDSTQKILGGAYDLSRLAYVGELVPVSGSFDPMTFFTNWEVCLRCNPDETLPMHIRSRERTAYLLPLYLRYEWLMRVVEGPMAQAMANERSRRFSGGPIVRLEPPTETYKLNFDPLVGPPHLSAESIGQD